MVSGVVWEYFNGTTQKWKIGMRKELQLDRLNGFIGKTVIHPNQIPIVNESLKVRNTDLEDAQIKHIQIGLEKYRFFLKYMV